MFACIPVYVHTESLTSVLLLDLGGVIRQGIQDLVQVTGGFVQPFDRVPEFVGSDLAR